MSAAEGANWLRDPNDIKQEQDIKTEPIETDNLVELPALIDNDDEQLVVVLNQWNGDGGNAVNPIDDIKIEVKDEAADTGKASKPKGKQHQCVQCGYTTKYKSHFETHLLVHTGEKPFGCSHCPNEFKSKPALKHHMKKHVDEFRFSCAICLKGFDEKEEKLAHEKECRIRRYECHLCKQSFGSKNTNLIRHIRIHSGTKPFQCKECSKKCNTKGNLKRHMETHVGPPSFHCSRCRLGFVHQNEMIAHEQNCSRRLYECYVCGNFFGLKKGNLEDHMRTHTGDKPFQCTMCPRKFTQKWNLTKHMNRKHN